MNKKEKNLLLLLLACACLLVAVLYSPIGSPENYIHNAYFIENQGVNFSGKIQNASRVSKYTNNYSVPSSFGSDNVLGESRKLANNPTISLDESKIEVAVPVYNSEKKNTANYKVSNPSSSSNNSSTINNATYSIQSKSNTIVPEHNNSGGGVVGGMGYNGGVIIGKTSDDDNNNNPEPNGFIALNNLDLSVFSDLTPKQGGGYSPGSGATDPGEDPIGQPIPVPDGFWLLLMMAAGYTATKYLKRKPQIV